LKGLGLGEGDSLFGFGRASIGRLLGEDEVVNVEVVELVGEDDNCKD